MSVKPELAFDVCWEVYRDAREVLESKRGVCALNWEDATKFWWRPDFRPRINEFVADFALAGKAALDDPIFSASASRTGSPGPSRFAAAAARSCCRAARSPHAAISAKRRKVINVPDDYRRCATAHSMEQQQDTHGQLSCDPGFVQGRDNIRVRKAKYHVETAQPDNLVRNQRAS